ncbi:hypothetical protein [Fannyhessea vaginae]|uniref:hypothetical protein n=1 Tax=Fannyhessea vaginae TaxID=82135 RepID=UPI00288AE51B|nr:hypothetical protein [Fannyhessea vaginae]
MELDRLDLIVIRNTLKHVIQSKDLFGTEILKSTENAVTDILTEYPNSNVFEVKPNKLEE